MKDISFLQTKSPTSQKKAEKQTLKNRESDSTNVMDLIMDVGQRISEIRTQASSWWQKSQQDLYGHLHKCLLLLVDIQSIDSKQQTQVVMAQIDEILKELTLDSMPTKLPNKIVACVFEFEGMDRKQISKYANVLNRFVEANSTKVGDELVFNTEKADEFISWLTNGGGISGVLDNKSTSTTNGLTAEQKLPIANIIVRNSVDTIVTIDNDFGIETDKAVLLYVVPTADGKQLEVKKVIDDEKKVNPITVSFYDKNKAEKHSTENVENEARAEVSKAS